MGKFADAVRAFAVVAQEQADAVVAEATREVGRRLITRSPVDTGKFRSNWNFAAGAPDITETARTNLREVNGIRDIPKAATAFTLFLSNSLPYATRLEFGHSKQAPQGMVRRTAGEWPAIVEAAAAKVSSQSYIASAVPYASARPPSAQ